MVTTKPVTLEDVEALPDGGDRYDVIRGVFQRMPPASFEHGGLAGEAYRVIANFVVERRLGMVLAAETGFILERDPLTLLAPDVAFVRTDRLPPRRDRWRFAELIPDLVVEVVSPSERSSEIEAKTATYLAVGVPLVWLLNPRRATVAVHRPGRPPQILGSGDTLDGEDVLPGFRLPVADLFRSIL